MKARFSFPICFALVATGCSAHMTLTEVEENDTQSQSTAAIDTPSGETHSPMTRARRSSASGASAVTGGPLVFTNGDGSTNSVHAAPGTALFTVATVTGQTVKDALVSWLQNGAYYGLGTSADIEIAEAHRAQNGALEIVHFTQTCHGIPHIGSAQNIVVTLDGDNVISVSGRPVDASISYAGLYRRMSETDAVTAMIQLYQSTHSSTSNPVVSELTLVAIAGLQSLGYKAEVKAPGEDAEGIVIDAVAGSKIIQQGLDYYSLDESRPVHLNVDQLGADPLASFEEMAWNMPGALTDSCPDPNNDDNCLVRMGSMRLSVYDYQQDNTAVPLVESMPIMHLFNPVEPWSKFLWSRPSYGFNTQNMYHKAVLATSAVDPFVSAIHWDHYPNVPWSSTEPASLQLMVNVDGQTPLGPYCGTSPANLGALGVYRGYKFSPADVAAVEPPYPGSSLPSISLCSNDESVLFHELGHYYDAHLSTGQLGAGIEIHNTCNPDTTDEAPPLAESVADMMASALYAKLYPNLAYNMSTTSMPCQMGVMGLPGSVHGDGCNAPRVFNDDRPQSVQYGACKKDAGYNQIGLQQAWWEFLKGKTCSSVAPYNCTSATQNPDTGIRALLFALKQSNAQSYKEFVFNMATWINANGTASEYTRFVDAFTHHGFIN